MTSKYLILPSFFQTDFLLHLCDFLKEKNKQKTKNQNPQINRYARNCFFFLKKVSACLYVLIYLSLNVIFNSSSSELFWVSSLLGAQLTILCGLTFLCSKFRTFQRYLKRRMLKIVTFAFMGLTAFVF